MMNKFFMAFAFYLIPMGLFANTPVEVPQNSLTQAFVMLSIVFVFFYIILWRPEKKRKQALEMQRSQLKKGDKVTAMGIIGTVEKLGEHTTVVKMYDGALVEFVSVAIAEVHN